MGATVLGPAAGRLCHLAEEEAAATVERGEVAEADDGAQGEGDVPFDLLVLAEARGDLG